MLGQNIVKIRGLQLVFLFAFYLSYFHMFLYYFLSLKKVINFLFQDGALWNSGSQETDFEHLTPLPPSSRYRDYIPYVVCIAPLRT